MGLMAVHLALKAQEDSASKPVVPESRSSAFSINGYVKDMQSLHFSKDFAQLNATNLIHNRINTKWMPHNQTKLVLELRNRLIWGDEVKTIPNYAQLLRNPNEKWDVSRVWFSNPSLVMHTNIDRLYLDLKYEELALRVGRQRINWGIATTWNPNDIFNSYNFLDFDYEERPGTDAVKLTAELTPFSGLEFAYAPANKSGGPVWAGKYFFNWKGYDFQLISGVFDKRGTLGLGWAGRIGNAGFKGEGQIFSATGNQKPQLNLCLESDYVFSGGWYAAGSLLYNNNGIQSPIRNPLELNFNFSPVNLMPTRWNFILSARKEITPLFSAGLSLLYAPGTHLLLALPGLRYNLTSNLDVDLIWQGFFAEMKKFEALSHRGFLRLKYSF